MSDTTKRIYEGMFLFPQSAIADMQTAQDHVHMLLERSDADIVSFRKWDERRLAYEIKGNKRGLYFLAYFNCDPAKIAALENDCNLSESLLRFLVTKADHINPEEIEAADGRAELADEITLRAAQAAEQTETNTTSSVSVGSKGEEAPAEEAAPEEAADADETQPEAKESEETPAEA